MKSVFENLENMSVCPGCGKKYQNAKMLILEEKGTKSAFHITCGKCQTSSLVFISSGQFGIVSMGTITDLNGREARELLAREHISANNVIDAYEFLKSFKGGISEII